uniref:Uncharacterized protein n=1 Tax=Anguilla anguilla TaxID=7936 RepID=A0A0E9WMD5_ANGAN
MCFSCLTFFFWTSNARQLATCVYKEQERGKQWGWAEHNVVMERGTPPR